MDILWHPDTPAPTCPGGMLEKMWTALQAPSVGVVIFSENSEREMGELMAATRLLRERDREPRLIVAATSHPSLPWLRRVRDLGTDRQWVVAGGNISPQGVIDQNGIIDIRKEPCPQLHTHTEREGVLSVCMAYAGRMVLAFPQFRRWCFSDPGACPHRRAASPISMPDSISQPLP